MQTMRRQPHLIAAIMAILFVSQAVFSQGSSGRAAAVVVFGLFFFRIRERFDSLDVSNLDQVAGLHR